ncbi:unnamed protein product [Orchesella dallaii]|uniref:Uncharacterized protein n=1 Tax=Orchesella dallaii TaxID=48710 RepID=A0ABP1PMU8_9HEXA
MDGLQKLSFQNSEEVSKRLEQELRRSMRCCHIRFLTKSVRILNKNEDLETSIGSSQEDSTVLPAAIKVLNRGWIEAVTGNLMDRICTDLGEDISRVQATTVISSLVISLGQMRYKNKGP